MKFDHCNVLITINKGNGMAVTIRKILPMFTFLSAQITEFKVLLFLENFVSILEIFPCPVLDRYSSGSQDCEQCF